MRPCEGGYRFKMSVDAFLNIRPIVRKTGTKVRIEKRHGLPFILYRYRKRKIFAVGAALCAAMIYISSLFVWNIEINGNSYLSDEVILDFLNERDAGLGSVISRIDCAALEEKLRSAHDEVVWTSIKINGTLLAVDIEENLLPDEAYENDDVTSYDIVASHEGVITHIFTRSGTPLVALNDTVVSGQVLVAGYIEITDDDGEVTKILDCAADADITAQYVVRYTDTIEKSYMSDEATGNVKTRYGIAIMTTGNEINIKNPFFYMNYDDFRVISDSSQFMLSEYFYLPFAVTRDTYLETVPTELHVTYDEAYVQADEIMASYMTDLDEKGVQILSNRVMIEETDDNYIVYSEFDVIQSVVAIKTKEGRL